MGRDFFVDKEIFLCRQVLFDKDNHFIQFSERATNGSYYWLWVDVALVGGTRVDSFEVEVEVKNQPPP